MMFNMQKNLEAINWIYTDPARASGISGICNSLGIRSIGDSSSIFSATMTGVSSSLNLRAFDKTRDLENL